MKHILFIELLLLFTSSNQQLYHTDVLTHTQNVVSFILDTNNSFEEFKQFRILDNDSLFGAECYFSINYDNMHKNEQFLDSSINRNPFSKQLKTDYAFTLFVLGLNDYYQSKPISAISHWQSSINILDGYNDKYLKKACLLSIAEVMNQNNEVSLAQSYYRTAFDKDSEAILQPLGKSSHKNRTNSIYIVICLYALILSLIIISIELWKRVNSYKSDVEFENSSVYQHIQSIVENNTIKSNLPADSYSEFKLSNRQKKQFLKELNKKYNGFGVNIMKQHPTLEMDDVLCCGLLVIGLKPQETAAFMGVGYRAIMKRINKIEAVFQSSNNLADSILESIILS